MKQRGMKILAMLLTLAMVVGLVPGMGLTVNAAALSKLTLNVGENGKVVMNNGIFGNATSDENIFKINSAWNVSSGSILRIDDGKSANMVEDGSVNIQPGGKFSFYLGSDNTGTITATPEDGYVFAGWYNGETLYSNNAELEYKNISEDLDLTAQFHTHDFTYSATSATITATCSVDGCPLPPSSEGGTDHVATLTIVAPTLTTYGGTGDAAATLTGLDDFKTATGKTIAATDIKYVGRDGTTYEEIATAPTNAGKYTAKITVEEKTASVDYEIEKVNQSVTEPTAKTDLVYNGESQKLINEPTITNGNYEGIRYQLDSGDWTDNIPYATNAGTYTVNYKVPGNENYNEYTGQPVTVTIAKANQEINSPTGRENLKYTGYEQNLLYTLPVVIKGNTLSTAQYRIGSEGAWSTSLPTGTAVGAYTVYYKIEGNNNYNEYNGSISVSIAKAANPASVTSTASVTKGGKTVDLAGNVTKNGATGDVSYAISGEANNCTLNGSVLTSGDTTGTVTVNVTVATDSNYEALAATPITVTISDKGTQTITASDVTATYGDTDKSVSASVTTPATGGGAISYAVKDGSGDYIDVAADGKLTIKAVPPTDGKAYVIVTAAETDDYAEATKEVVVTISKATVTVAAENQSIYVGGTVPDLSSPVLDTHYTVTGLVGEDALTTAPVLAYQKDGSAATPDNTTAGTYDIVASGASAGDNYTITYANGTLAISGKGNQTITADNVTVTYGDTGKSVSASVSTPATGGGAISYAVKSGSEDYIDVNASTGALTIKKVGTATVVVTAAETSTYAQATKEVTVTINKATAPAVTVPTPSAVTYDPAKTLADISLPTGWVWVTGTTVPTVTNSGYEAALTVDDANYDYTNVEGYSASTHKVTRTVSLTVNKAEVTAPTIASKTYTGETLTADVTVTADTPYTVTTNSGGTNVGSYDVVLTLSDSGNYKWTDSTEAAKTLSFQITKATAPEVTVPTLTAVTYDPAKKLSDITLSDGWAWVADTTVPTVTNSGYEAALTVDDANYNYSGVQGYSATTHKVTRTVSLTVNKAEVTAPTIASKVYNGQTQTADVAESTLYSVTTNNGGTNVGSYDVVLTLTDSANYKWTDSTEAAKTLSFQITKATAPEVTVPTLNAVTYDPAKKLSDITLSDGWAWVTSTTVPTVGNSGYEAALTVDDANYDYTNVEGYDATTHKVTKNVSLTVNKAEVTAPTIASKTYTGENQTADVTASTLYSVTTNNGGTNVGSYDVVLTLSDSGNYKWTDSTEAAKTLSFQITKAAANTVTVNIEGWTYGEAAKAPTSTATFGTAAYAYAIKGSTQFAAEVPTNAGEYTVKAAVAGTDNYPAGEAITDFTIARASITPTVNITGWTIGETANTPSVTGNTGDGAVTYTYAVKGSTQFDATVPTNAGEYTVRASIAATANYNGAEATADFTIAKKIPVAGVDFSVEPLQLTYTGSPQELVRQTILTDGLEIEYSFDNGASIETGLPMKKASGEYKIYYRVIGNDIYETLDWTGPVTATITMYATFRSPDFVLPAFLTEIGEEAFAEDTSLTIMDASNCAKIDAYAFRGCTNLKRIRLAQNCEIDDTAFDGCVALRAIFAPSGGTTAAWCASHDVNFVPISQN